MVDEFCRGLEFELGFCQGFDVAFGAALQNYYDEG